MDPNWYEKIRMDLHGSEWIRNIRMDLNWSKRSHCLDPLVLAQSLGSKISLILFLKKKLDLNPNLWRKWKNTLHYTYLSPNGPSISGLRALFNWIRSSNIFNLIFWPFTQMHKNCHCADISRWNQKLQFSCAWNTIFKFTFFSGPPRIW